MIRYARFGEPAANAVYNFWAKRIKDEAMSHLTTTKAAMHKVFDLKYVRGTVDGDPLCMIEDRWLFATAAVNLETTGYHGITPEAVDKFHSQPFDLKVLDAEAAENVFTALFPETKPAVLPLVYAKQVIEAKPVVHAKPVVYAVTEADPVDAMDIDIAGALKLSVGLFDELHDL
jgi:hypothetical protein